MIRSPTAISPILATSQSLYWKTSLLGRVVPSSLQEEHSTRLTRRHLRAWIVVSNLQSCPQFFFSGSAMTAWSLDYVDCGPACARAQYQNMLAAVASDVRRQCSYSKTSFLPRMGCVQHESGATHDASCKVTLIKLSLRSPPSSHGWHEDAVSARTVTCA